jgi:ABC-type hemin transport system ATPase subunit
VVAVLHDLNIALQYGDAFLPLDRGRLALDTGDSSATPRELLEPVSRIRAAA